MPPRPPLDAARLEALALAYVGRYATTQAKLAAYLERKLRTGGWGGDEPPPVAAIVDRLAALGYVDDRAFAEVRGNSLLRRGFGPARVGAALKAAGIDEDDAAPVREAAHAGAREAALALARRRRIGPYAPSPPDRDAQRRAIAILVRAGHDFALARSIACARDESDVEPK